LLGKQINMIAAGVNHSICVTDRGDIYCCGYNAKGQLGLGVDKFITNWTHVTELQGKKVSKVFAGGDHSWCVLGNLILM
jgi:alpha-tubulin suppressor-like RCC1 family protein